MRQDYRRVTTRRRERPLLLEGLLTFYGSYGSTLLTTTPITCACTASSAARAFFTWSRLTMPAPTTSTQPSTFALSTAASVTATTGGESSSTTSARRISSSKIESIRVEPSSSAGFGGVGPLGSTNRPGTAVAWSGGSMCVAAP